MRLRPTATAATLVAALTIVGCGVDDAPKMPKDSARSSAKARCAGQECRVRVLCKGELSIRLGAAPVRIRTSKTALRTAISLDFAGSRDDTVVRC